MSEITIFFDVGKKWEVVEAWQRRAERDMLGRFLVESRRQQYPRISKAERLCILAATSF